MSKKKRQLSACLCGGGSATGSATGNEGGATRAGQRGRGNGRGPGEKVRALGEWQGGGGAERAVCGRYCVPER